MKYKIVDTSAFRKSLKRVLKRDTSLRDDIQTVIDTLASGKTLDRKYQDHALKGEYKGSRECHIRPDLLLVYKQNNRDLILILIEIGTHSDIF